MCHSLCEDKVVNSMLEIKNIQVTYEKDVFKDCHFECGMSQITAIVGESGTGKTTLLNLISLRKKASIEYCIDQHPVEENMINQNIYYATQNPIFEEDLTIQENISLLYDVYNQEVDIDLEKEIIYQLDLGHTLLMYPNALSQGEKKRVSLLLAVITKRKIVLLDEPTASIDQENKERVYDVIKTYLHDRITIISTHDQQMIDLSDVVYFIHDAKLIRQGHVCNDEIFLCSYEPKRIESSYWKTLKHHKFYHIVTQVLTVVMISSLVLGLFSINVFIDSQKEYLNKSFSNQFVVYSPLVEGKGYSQNEYPLTETQFNGLNSIEGVKSVRELYCLSNLLSQEIYVHDQSILEEDEVVYYVSYDETKDYTQYIEEKYSASGVYISKELADQIGDIEKGEELTFQLPVPQYNIFNEGYVVDGYDLSKPDYYIVYPDEHNVEVTLPIAGTLKEDVTKLGMTLSLGEFIIYVPQNIYEQYLTKYAQEGGYTKGEVEYKPYQANAYVVELNSAKDVTSFQENLEQYQLATDSEYFDSYVYLQTQKNINEFQQQIILVLAIGMTCIVVVLKYLRRKQDLSFFEYIRVITMNKEIVRKVEMQCLLQKTCLTFLLSLLLCFLIILILSYVLNQIYTLSLLSIFICFLFSLFVETIPLLIRKIKNDRIKSYSSFL